MGSIPRLKEKAILCLRHSLFELIDFPTAITLFSLRICNELKELFKQDQRSFDSMTSVDLGKLQ